MISLLCVDHVLGATASEECHSGKPYSEISGILLREKHTNTIIHLSMMTN